MFFHEEMAEEKFTADLGIDILYPYSPVKFKKGLISNQVFEANNT